jgi:hypothetical protein
VEPALVVGVITVAVDMFVEHVSEVPIEAFDFLLETDPSIVHEDLITAVPEFAMSFDHAGNTVTVGFKHMFLKDLSIQRRQLPMPVHDLRLFVG